jgi:hypothetical protein
MKLSELKKTLGENADKNLVFILPTGTKIPVHAHVTDVARIEKRFIDCGGTFRTETLCRLQVWFADDTEHRVTARILLKILEKSASFLESDDLDVEIEYEAPFISQFPISELVAERNALVVRLGTKHTACLAEDQCGISAPKAQNILFKPLATLEKPKCC